MIALWFTSGVFAYFMFKTFRRSYYDEFLNKDKMDGDFLLLMFMGFGLYAVAYTLVIFIKYKNKL